MQKNRLTQWNTTNTKGQKIAAALYLITGHLPENDPLRLELRDLSIAVALSSRDGGAAIFADIRALLEVARIAKVISEKNCDILEAELKYAAGSSAAGDVDLSLLFPGMPVDKGQFLDKRTHEQNMSFISNKGHDYVLDKNHINKTLNKELKNKRQDKILSYINERKSANIKDIASLFPDISEKTIQRELSVLVGIGKIRKHGNKRWSLYLAI